MTTVPDSTITRVAVAVAREGITVAVGAVNSSDVLLSQHILGLDQLDGDEREDFMRRLNAELAAIRTTISERFAAEQRTAVTA